MFENRDGKPLCERLGESARAAGFARIITLTTPVLFSMLIGLLSWIGHGMYAQFEATAQGVASIQLFLAGAQVRANDRDHRLDQHDARLDQHDARLNDLGGRVGVLEALRRQP